MALKPRMTLGVHFNYLAFGEVFNNIAIGQIIAFIRNICKCNNTVNVNNRM